MFDALPSRNPFAKLQARSLSLARCEAITRVLMRRSGLVEGFEWPCPLTRWSGGPKTVSGHRVPPLPFHSHVHREGHCRVCGQPIYGDGDWRSASRKPRRSLMTWHRVCVASYDLMTKPASYAGVFVHRQGGRCAITGEPITAATAEIDHDVPLFRVAREHAGEPWHELVRFWGSGNLRALSRGAHVAKCAAEAKERARHRRATNAQGAML